MPSHHAKDAIKIKIQTPSGEFLDVDVFYDTKLSDLVLDLTEFLGKKGSDVNLELFDPNNPERNSILDLNLTIGQLGIRNGDRLLFITKGDQNAEDDLIIVELV